MYSMEGIAEEPKGTTIDNEIIRNAFRKYTFQKQVITYASALQRERYELLCLLAPCIPAKDTPDFLVAVQRWLNKQQTKDGK